MKHIIMRFSLDRGFFIVSSVVALLIPVAEIHSQAWKLMDPTGGTVHVRAAADVHNPHSHASHPQRASVLLAFGSCKRLGASLFSLS